MNETVLNEIKQAVKNIRFGSVEIVIHDSKIVQIERKEKLRFSSEKESTQAPKPERL